MTIRIIDHREAVRDLAPDWQRLLLNSDCHRTFSSCPWYSGYISAHAGCIPQVIVLKRDGQIDGIMPLIQDHDSGELRFIDDLADYQDVIVHRNDRQTVSQLIEAAGQLGDCQFRGLRPGANLLQAFAHDSGLPLYEQQDDATIADRTCYYADLSDGYESFLASRSSNFRFNLRKAKRRAEERGVRAVELKPDEMPGEVLVEHFLRLHVLRFPGRLFSRPRAQSFCRRLLPLLFQQHLLRAFALRQDEQLVGVHLAVVDQHALGIWNGGFDPAVASIAPGKLLIDTQVRACCNERLAEFDFLRGDEAYKKSWSTAERINRELRITRENLNVG